MSVVKAKSVPKKILSSEEILATFCYKFPQYTYAEARQLPFPRVRRMLKAADKVHAQHMLELCHIMASAMSGKGMASVVSSFKRVLED